MGDPLFAAPNLLGQFIQNDTGAEFLDRLVESGLKTNRKRPPVATTARREAGGKTDHRQDTPAGAAHTVHHAPPASAVQRGFRSPVCRVRPGGR